MAGESIFAKLPSVSNNDNRQETTKPGADVYRAYLLIGSAICAAAMSYPLMSDATLRMIPPEAMLLEFGAGALFLGVAILDGATDTRRKWWSMFAIGLGALAFAFTAAVISMKVFGVVDVVAVIPIKYFLFAGFAMLAAASFAVKPSRDANLANMWLAISCVAAVGAVLLGGTRAYIMMYCAMMLLVISSLLITTEKRRGKWGAIAPNIAALAFGASAAILVARVSLGQEPKWVAYGAADPYVLGAGGALLGGWVMLLFSARALKQSETGGNRFSAWLFRVSLASVIAIGFLYYLAFNATGAAGEGLAPLAALTVFFACIPLVILVAVFAVTEGARLGPGAALLELAAIAFVAAGAAALIYVSLVTYPPSKEHSFTDPQLIARVVAGLSLAGWVFMALSALGLRSRAE